MKRASFINNLILVISSFAHQIFERIIYLPLRQLD